MCVAAKFWARHWLLLLKTGRWQSISTTVHTRWQGNCSGATRCSRPLPLLCGSSIVSIASKCEQVYSSLSAEPLMQSWRGSLQPGLTAPPRLQVMCLPRAVNPHVKNSLAHLLPAMCSTELICYGVISRPATLASRGQIKIDHFTLSVTLTNLESMSVRPSMNA